MAEICIFKTPQAKADFWARLEKELNGWLPGGNWDQNCLPSIVARFRRIYDIALARQPEASFQLEPIVRLTPEEFSGLKKQVEEQFTERVYSEFIGQIMLSVLCEIGDMEDELYRLRQKTEVGSQKQPRSVPQLGPAS